VRTYTFILTTTKHLKKKLAIIIGKSPDDLRFHKFLTEEEKQAIIEERQKQLAKPVKGKKPPEPKKEEAKGDAKSEEFVSPSLDETKTVCEVGLDTDHVLFYVCKIKGTNDEWEPIDVEGLQPAPKKDDSASGQTANGSSTTTAASAASSSTGAAASATAKK